MNDDLRVQFGVGQPLPTKPTKPQFDKHKFRRDANGSVRIHLNLRPEEADLIEQAAVEGTPLLAWMRRELAEGARKDIREREEP